MDFVTLCTRLGFSSQEISRLESEKHRDLSAIQRKMPTISIQDYYALQEEAGWDAILAAALFAALDTWQFYREKGMPEQIFWDTMGMFRRFMGETQVRFGRYFFDRGWWTWRILAPTEFRIGCLEYEMCRDKLSLHIPSDANLDTLDQSISQARDFFSRFYPDYCRVPWVCHSWLLSPQLRPFLGEGSRILRFQNLFTLTDTDGDEACLQWLFAAREDTPLESLPQDTSLQRRVKAFLLSGGTVGQGRGVLTPHL